MSELKERFSLADGISTRDLWSEARRRAAVPAELPASGDTRWTPGRRRLGTATLAYAVFAAAAVFAWNAFHPDGPSPRPRPALDRFDLSVYPEGWTRLPDPPEVRSDAATAWTGAELLIWGGGEVGASGVEQVRATGFRFDPASGEWNDLPAAPLEARMRPASAWTGRELLIWGGGRPDTFPEGAAFFDDGAAYDPVARDWRRLPPAPLEARAPFSVWSGDELIVWGNQARDLRYLDGAAYDPSTNSWRMIADAPIELTDGTAVWTGEVMLVFGAALHGGNLPESETAVGAAYDPETDRWERIADSDLSPKASTAAWDGRHMIAWDYENHTASYDWTTDTWRKLPDVDIWTGECSPESVGVGRFVFGNYCGIQVLFFEGRGGWDDVTRKPGIRDVVVPIPADSVTFALEYNREVIEFADRRMFVYAPPVVRTNPKDELLEPKPFIPPVERDGDLIRMPVVFPDGSRATLVYPITLDLATLGVQPDFSYVSDAYFPIVFLRDPDASLESFVDPDGGSRLVNTSEGGLEIFRARGNDVEQRFWIRFELPSWTVLVSVQDQLRSAVAVAGALDLRETSSGFPVVEATDPIALAEGFGEAGGAELAFGDGTADPSTVSQLDSLIHLSPDGCTSAVDSGPSEGYGAICLGEGNVFASIYGDRAFVAKVIEGLRVEDFRQA